MNISGILIHVSPGKVAAVKAAVSAFPGVEVHAATDDGRLVLTLDCQDNAAAADSLFKMNGVDGVLNASLVYHNFEPDPVIEHETGRTADGLN